MKNKQKLVSIILLLVVVLIWFAFQNGYFNSRPVNTTLETIKASDVHRLDIGTDAPAETAKSLKRMAFQNPEKAKEFVPQYLSHESGVLRGAAYYTAGMFQGDQWDQRALAGLADADVVVRLATLQGLSRQPSEKRKEAVEAFLLNKNRTASEKLWGRMLIMLSTSDVTERSRQEKSVLSLLSQVDRETQSEALIELYKLWPDRLELKTLAEKVVHAGQETADFLPSFRYLSSYSPEELASTLNASVWPDSRSYLLDVANFLAEHCPKSWESLLGKVEKHKQMDKDIQAEVDKLELAERCQKIK